MTRLELRRLKMLSTIGVSAVVAACVCGIPPAGATPSSKHQRYTIAYSVPLGKTDPQTKAAEQFARQVERKTKGAVKVVVYTTDSLGTQTQIDQEVSSGTSQMVATAPGDISTLYPPLSVVTLPFLFSNTRQVFSAENGKLGKQLSKGMEHKAGIRILAWGALGWVQLLSKTQTIKTLAGLKGLKVRTAGTPEEDGAFKAAGAVPVPLEFGTLFTGLQTGTVQACALPLTVIESGKFYQAAPDLTNVNFFYQNSVVFINNTFYKSLPKAYRKIVRQAANQAARHERKDLQKKLPSEVTFLKNNGGQVGTLTASARSQWAKQSTITVIKPFAKQYGKFVKLAKKYT